MSIAKKVLPPLLVGLLTDVLSRVIEKAITGNGLFLGSVESTTRIDFEGEGMTFTAVEDDDINGLYLKHDGQIYRGEGLILGKNSPSRNIPILCLRMP